MIKVAFFGHKCFDQHHITNGNQIAGRLGLFAALAVFQLFARPGHILGRDPMAVCVILYAFDTDLRIVIANPQHHRRGRQPCF